MKNWNMKIRSNETSSLIRDGGASSQAEWLSACQGLLSMALVTQLWRVCSVKCDSGYKECMSWNKTWTPAIFTRVECVIKIEYVWSKIFLILWIF